MPKVSVETVSNRKARNRELRKQETKVALSLGLQLPQFRILRAVVRSGDAGLTYRQIHAKTAYYSVLAAVLRGESNKGREHGDSLGFRGLVREVQYDGEPLRFVATAKGRKLLDRAKQK